MPSVLLETPLGRVPQIVADAGDQAVAAYLAYLQAYARHPRTQQKYRSGIDRFSRWAKDRGLTMATVTAADASAYAARLTAGISSPYGVTVALTPLRGLFHHLTASGVIADNPFGSPRRRAAASRPADPPKSSADGKFPLLSVLAMLAYMEEQTLGRVLTEEPIARKLLNFVRWRDGRTCTQCGAPGEDAEDVSEGEGREFRCPACGRHYAVTDASPFEGLPMPLQDGLLVLFRLYLSDAGQPAETPLDRPIDEVAAGLLAGRIQLAFARQGLAAGEGLRPAIDRRNQELEQDEIARDIIEYAELEAHRTALRNARAEGAAVDDLPPGMTLEEAIATLDERIAEHDRYQITLKDGYLAYHWPKTGESAEAERPAAPPADAQEARHEH